MSDLYNPWIRLINDPGEYLPIIIPVAIAIWIFVVWIQKSRVNALKGQIDLKQKLLDIKDERIHALKDEIDSLRLFKEYYADQIKRTNPGSNPKKDEGDS